MTKNPKFKTFKALKMFQSLRPPFLRKRTVVERLEDRVLLSAEPMLQQNRPDDTQPLAVDNIQIEVGKVQSAYDIASFASYSTRIDLSSAGAGASQNSALSGSADLLTLNKEMINLVLDLGTGNDDVQLSTEADGKLRLSGSSIHDLVFPRPTGILAIRGGDGLDRVLLGDADLGSASLIVEAESISLPVGKSLTSGADLVLRGLATAAKTSAQDITLDLQALVDVQGAMLAGGQVVLEASLQTRASIAHEVVVAYDQIKLTSQAIAQVGAGARIQAQGLQLLAYTDNDLQIASQGGLASVVDISADQTTRASVAGGATLLITPKALVAGEQAVVSVLIEAVDRSHVSVELNTADSLVTSLAAGIDIGLGSIGLVRNTSATLGDSASKPISLKGLVSASAGLVQVNAANADGDGGGIAGAVNSSLVGVQTNRLQDQVLARVQGANLKVDGLQVLALNAVSDSASAKVARNIASGSVQALLLNADLGAIGDVIVVARDQASFDAQSGGFSAAVPLLNNVQIGVASASNTINRTTQAQVLDSKLDSGGLAVLASSSASATAGTESMAVTGGDAEGAADMSISLAGTFAWNQLLGGVKASLQGSTVNSTGELRVQALNATKVDATSTAGTSVTESAGSAGGASLAFNAVGWDMGNIAAAALNSLIGTDVGFTVLPLETLAFISTSQVSAAGDVAVTAQDLIEISAFLSNSAEASSGAATSALSAAAGAVLASNRVRSSTRAYIDGRDSQGLRHYALTLGAGLEVLADDAASMKRVNFELSADQHTKLKIYATRQGKTIKELLTEYVASLPD